MELMVIFKLYLFAVIVDFISGVLAASKEGRLKSRTCAYGLYRSAGELITLSCAIILTHYVPLITNVIQYIMLGILFKEGISICENLARLDVWLPDILKKTLEAGADKVDKGEK